MSPSLVVGDGLIADLLATRTGAGRDWRAKLPSRAEVRALLADKAPYSVFLLADTGLWPGAAAVTDALGLVEEVCAYLAGPGCPRGGSLVVVGTEDAWGSPAHPRSAALNAAMVAVVRSFALRVAATGQRVNMVCGPSHGSPEESSPLGISVQPADVVAAALFLADPVNSYITGQIVHCGGGRHLLTSLSA